MSTKHQKIDVKLPSGYSSDIREAIAAEIISVIRKRTIKNKDKDGEKFPSYSKDYTKSVDFRAAGKSKGDINLTLSGDMLASMELLENKKSKISIGFEDGTVQNAKADGNIRGTYGKPKPIPGKARDFLGISSDELEKILKKYPKDDDKAEARADAILKANEKIQKRLDSIEINELSSDEIDQFFTLTVGKK
jgi:hypothetical protein